MAHELEGDDVAALQTSLDVKDFGRKLAVYAGRALRGGGIKLSEPAQRLALHILDMAYGGKLFSCPHDEISQEDMKAFAKDPGSSRGAETYGELDPVGFLDILWRVGAKPGSKFYDLGSGTGKLVAVAWMAGLHATGVELSEVRWEASQCALAELCSLSSGGSLPQGGVDCPAGLPLRCESGIRFLHSSFFQVDFTDADLVYVSSVMFTKAMVAKLADLVRWMKPGSRIISYHSLDDLEQFGQFPELVEIGEVTGPASWNLSASWKVHEVLHSPADCELRPSFFGAAKLTK
eukprot:TRINITY_DN107016_c0_g1_i1.p1 TRINITY_DN107016_c0_g1~~TRINITY_DN107016_c0_g1_i1.p1  ORF type:complete len:291 (+),score=52.31 TRINITY_DN107016_c0_g1_i1:84-956(+)